jgi:hypothetical protein
MDKFLCQDVPEEVRVEQLEANADSIEEVGYMRNFTNEELDEFKEELADNSIKINDIEIEKKEAMAGYKKQIDPLQEVVKTNLKRIKEKSEFVKEPCYKFTYPLEGMVGFYNSRGELVSSRPLRGDERQGRIFPLKTGTNN